MTTPTPREALADERAKFEDWASGEGMDVSYWLNGPEHGYDNPRVADYWGGWKARAALAVPAGCLAEVQPIPEQDAKDALRYRWLRDKSPANKSFAPRATLCDGHGIKVRWHGFGDGKHLPSLFLDGENLDAAIDAAMNEPT